MTPSQLEEPLWPEDLDAFVAHGMRQLEEYLGRVHRFGLRLRERGLAPDDEEARIRREPEHESADEDGGESPIR